MNTVFYTASVMNLTSATKSLSLHSGHLIFPLADFSQSLKAGCWSFLEDHHNPCSFMPSANGNFRV